MTRARSLAQTLAPLLVLACYAAPASAEPGAMGEKMLIHGNYCGPGNNAPLPPIDALDAACARHDACTPTGGLPTAACNARLQREAELISRDPRQPEDVRAMAGLVASTVPLIPSEPGSRRVPATAALGPAPGTYAPAPQQPGLPADGLEDPDGQDDAD